MKKSVRGQGMVEFAFVIVVFMAVVMGLVDIGPVLFDLSAAKQMSARGARAAAIYSPDGSRTCRTDVINSIGNPQLLMSSWSLSMSANCTNNPLSTRAPSETVRVTVGLVYDPMFWPGDPWTFQLGTTDQGR